MNLETLTTQELEDLSYELRQRILDRTTTDINYNQSWKDVNSIIEIIELRRNDN